MIILETKGLTKRFGNSPALDNVDITLECGKIVGLLRAKRQWKDNLSETAERASQTRSWNDYNWRRNSGHHHQTARIISAGQQLFSKMDESNTASGIFWRFLQ